MRFLLSAGLIVFAVAACSSDDSSSTSFNEDAARNAAIEWNPGDTDGVDSWVDTARELCGDNASMSEWITSSQDYAETEKVEIVMAGCAETVAEVAQELALPVPGA